MREGFGHSPGAGWEGKVEMSEQQTSTAELQICEPIPSLIRGITAAFWWLVIAQRGIVLFIAE